MDVGEQRATTSNSCGKTGRVEVRFGSGKKIMEGKVREDDGGNGGQRRLFYDGGVKFWEQLMVGWKRGSVDRGDIQ